MIDTGAGPRIKLGQTHQQIWQPKTQLDSSTLENELHRLQHVLRPAGLFSNIKNYRLRMTAICISFKYFVVIK